MIDWEAIPCRHRCPHHAVGLYYVPEGCNCFPDPVQALCEQHFIKLHSAGPITTIVRQDETDLLPVQDVSDPGDGSACGARDLDG